MTIMDVERVKELIAEHQEDIRTIKTRNERLDYIINLLDESYPDIPIAIALLGPITMLPAPAEHIEIQKIIQALRYIQSVNDNVCVQGLNGGQDLAEIIEYIQHIIS